VPRLAVLPPLNFFIFQMGVELESCLDGVPFSVTRETRYLLIFFLSFFILLLLKEVHFLKICDQVIAQ
jgi:hypothetical protein